MGLLQKYTLPADLRFHSRKEKKKGRGKYSSIAPGSQAMVPFVALGSDEMQLKITLVLLTFFIFDPTPLPLMPSVVPSSK